MAYRDFKSRTEVMEKFGLKFSNREFLQEIPFKINSAIEELIIGNFKKPGVFNSEYSICEAIIYPIIAITSSYNELPIWSHCRFDVDANLNLVGEPDYLFALSREGDEEFLPPVVCLGEAKKEDLKTGWAQVSAEMVAAQKLNNSQIPIYGLVTTGKLWEFAVLDGKEFISDPNSYTAPLMLEKLLAVLNWLFDDAKKNALKIIK